MNARAAVIVPAAGRGRRMGSLPKAFLSLAGRPVLYWALEVLLSDPRVIQAVVAVDRTTAADPPQWLKTLDPRVSIVAGGEERMLSVRNALLMANSEAVVAVVHDAARPLVSKALVSRVIDEAAAGRSVTTALPVSDTVHQVAEDGRIVATPDRSRLWRAQTPQAFPMSVLKQAYQTAGEARVSSTDDASLVARLVGPVHVVEGESANIKLTVPEDMLLAELLLRQRS
jgi:2-C-methyl-D-erythritol 4-phosphate cytidylyltransferase